MLHSLHAGGSGVRFFDGPDLKLFVLVGWSFSVWGSTGDSLLFQIFSYAVWQSRDLQLSHSTLDQSNPRLLFFMVLFVIYLFYRVYSLAR